MNYDQVSNIALVGMNSRLTERIELDLACKMARFREEQTEYLAAYANAISSASSSDYSCFLHALSALSSAYNEVICKENQYNRKLYADNQNFMNVLSNPLHNATDGSLQWLLLQTQFSGSFALFETFTSSVPYTYTS